MECATIKKRSNVLTGRLCPFKFLAWTCFSLATSDTFLHPLLSSRINQSSNICLGGGILYTLAMWQNIPSSQNMFKTVLHYSGRRGSALTQYLDCLCRQHCRQHSNRRYFSFSEKESKDFFQLYSLPLPQQEK